MTQDSIDALRRAVPDAFNVAHTAPAWPEQIIAVPADSDLADEIDDYFAFPDHGGDTDPLANAAVPSDAAIERAVNDADPSLGWAGLATAREAIDLMRDRPLAWWPGLPGGGVAQDAPDRAGGIAPVPMSTDALAFYLPYHLYPEGEWGIHLIAEGIEALGRAIHRQAQLVLSRAQAYRAAQMFLFHHQVYHNAAESFATRLEVAFRRPCYLPGVLGCGTGLLPRSGLHEEGLANAYALAKLRDSFLTDTPMATRRRHAKRTGAVRALERFVVSQPTAHASAAAIQTGAVTFDEAQREWQEACHHASGFEVPVADSAIWQAAPFMMAPSIPRGRKFRTIISRTHPAIRFAGYATQCPQREVIRRLELASGGRILGGVTRPSLVLRGGQRIPIPPAKELPRASVRALLRQARIPLPLSEFLMAADAELRWLAERSGSAAAA